MVSCFAIAYSTGMSLVCCNKHKTREHINNFIVLFLVYIYIQNPTRNLRMLNNLLIAIELIDA